MDTSILTVALASFASGLGGSMLGAIAIIIGMRRDLAWIKESLSHAWTKINSIDDKLDNTRETVHRNMP